jgi:chromosome segregation ATPase
MTDEPSAAEPLWASFQDVVEQLTGPLAASTVERVAEEVGRLDKSLAELRKDLNGLAVEQDDAARALKKQQEALTRENQQLRCQLETLKDDLAEQLKLSHEAQSAAAREDTAAVLREVSRAIEEARSSSTVLEAAVGERLARLRTSWAADVEALRARQSATERLARVTVVLLSLTLVLGAVGVVLR